MLIIAFPFISDAQHPSKGSLSISFHHYVNEMPLDLDSAQYKNELGQSYRISNFKYYISNIQLKSPDGNLYTSKEHFLIQEDESETKKIDLKGIPEGSYQSICFMIGIDSVHNCSGAQSGALDPANGMFWAWNTGYIFLKLEGKSAFSKAPGNIFEYHIGGYKAPSNCIRVVELKLEDLLQVGSKGSDIGINLNVAEILKNPSNIDFSVLPAVTDHKNASLIADNYKDMFSIAEKK
jgi:hypothetical protein